MLNTGGYRFKQSRTDKITNIALLMQVVILLVLIIVMGICNYAFTKNNMSAHYLFEKIDNVGLFSVKAALSYYLLFNQLIPLGLSIFTEIYKIF